MGILSYLTLWPRTVFTFHCHIPAKRIFSGVYLNQPVCPSVCLSIHVSVFVQNTIFCQSAGGGIKSHSVTALVIVKCTVFFFSHLIFDWKLYSIEKGWKIYVLCYPGVGVWLHIYSVTPWYGKALSVWAFHVTHSCCANAKHYKILGGVVKYSLFWYISVY